MSAERCRSAGKAERDAHRREGAGADQNGSNDSAREAVHFRFLNFDFGFLEEPRALLDFGSVIFDFRLV